MQVLLLPQSLPHPVFPLPLLDPCHEGVEGDGEAALGLSLLLLLPPPQLHHSPERRTKLRISLMSFRISYTSVACFLHIPNKASQTPFPRLFSLPLTDDETWDGPRE